MKIMLLSFANVKDIIGKDTAELDMPEGSTCADVYSALAEQYPRLSGYGASLSFIVNEEFAAPVTVLSDGDEVVFVPPVSGGSDPAGSSPVGGSPVGSGPVGSGPQREISEANFDITRGKIDGESVYAKVVETEGYAGAIILFYGITRTHSRGRVVNYLEYDGYEKVAKKQLYKLGLDASSRFEIIDMAITHRLGEVPSGECSVVIAVSSAHRDAAYQASRFAIEEIKKIVPIWKKEIFDDGEVWIEGGQPSEI